MKTQIRLHSLLSCVLLSVLAPILVEAAPPAADETLARAWELLQQKKYREAAREFTRAEKLLGGRCGDCLLGLSRARVGLGDRKGAADAARQAIPLLETPEAQADAWNQLGVALVGDKTRNLAEAEEAFRKALQLGGENLVRVNLAEVLFRAGKHDEALELAREALKPDLWGPDSTGARIVLCQAKRVTSPPILDPVDPAEGESCGPDVKVADGAERPAEGEVQRPRKIFGQAPWFPKGPDSYGKLVLEAVIDEEGCVRNIRVCRSLGPSMDRATQETLSKWVFQPASLDGKPVAVYYTLTVTFTKGG